MIEGSVFGKNFNYSKCFTNLLGSGIDIASYWVDKRLIPIGTLRPQRDYKGEIPFSEIVTIPFDSITKSFTERKPTNILLLGGSGDGKSLQLKQIWFILSQAGYWITYFDPKSFDSGRAKKSWTHNRLAPNIKPQGIELEHFVPAWAEEKIEHLKHNFNLHSIKIKDFVNKDYWQGLGMSSISAIKCDKICGMMRERKIEITVDKIKRVLAVMRERDELSTASYNNAISVLSDIEYYNLVNTSKYDVLNPLPYWQKGKSVCVSYAGKFNPTYMAFDIGLRIQQAISFYYNGLLRRPVMFIFDDASFFAKDSKMIKFNFASQEIIDIGNLYRSLGLNNVLAVQTLGIIDDEVANTYKIKLISPKFSSPETLRKINIPDRVIKYLEKNLLFKDSKSHYLQWLKVDENNDVVPYFPFLPPVDHFEPVYFPKKNLALEDS